MINSPWVSRPIPRFRLWQADLVDDYDDILIAVGKPEVMYCAPPNAEHHLFWWDHSYPYATFLRKFIDVAKAIAAPTTVIDCFSNRVAVIDALTPHWPFSYVAPVTYEAPTTANGGGRAVKTGGVQLVLSHRYISAPDPTETLGSRAALRRILSDLPPSTVFDPCVGKGLAMQVAYETGHGGIGTDISIERLEAASTWLKTRKEQG